MGTEQKRRMIQGEILSMVGFATSEGHEVSKKKLEAELCLKHGFTRRKSQEYLNILIDAEKLVETDGFLKLKDETDKDL